MNGGAAAHVSSRPVSFFGSGGVRLVGEGVGDPRHPPVVLLHGAGQTRHAWGSAAEALAGAGWYAVALDLRGHGDSDWPDDGSYTVEGFAEDVLAVVDALGQPPALVGASLGGMAALAAQGRSTGQLFRALVLVDVTPRLEPGGVARVVGFMAAHPDGFASLEEAAAVVARYRPGRVPRRDRGGLTRVLRRTPDGRYRWRWDPRFLVGIGDLAGGDPEMVARRTGEISALLTEAAQRVEVPTLVVRGRLSDVTSGEGVAQFLEAVPHAEHIEVGGAGHMVAGDQNDAFRSAVVAFLNRAVPGGTVSP